MKRNLYYDGQLIDRTDELQMDCLNTIGTTYDEAAKPENQELMHGDFPSDRRTDQPLYPHPSEHGRPA